MIRGFGGNPGQNAVRLGGDPSTPTTIFFHILTVVSFPGLEAPALFQGAPGLGRMATVADHDEVGRVRADSVEQGLGSVAGDEPLLDVFHSLPGKTGDRFLQGRAGGPGTVDVAVQPCGGARSRAGLALLVAVTTTSAWGC
jgi:hypothetical protein